MSGGINMDEEKRRLQYMQFRTEQKLESSQNMNFEGKKHRKNPKDALVTIGVIAGLVLVVYVLRMAGVL